MPLHPQSKDFLDGLAKQNAPGWEELPPAESREIFASLTDFFGDGPEVAAVEDRTIRDDLSVRVYWPSGNGPFPGIVFFHGGGWVLGSLETHDALCRRLAYEGEAVVVAVEYPLSPESVFPGSLEYCFEATQFVAKHADNLQIDPAKIIVAGDSAGGNLAAAVALLSCERGGPQLFMQVLIYPALNARCDSDSYSRFAEGNGLTKIAMQWFWQQYLGSSANPDDPIISPGMSDNLQQLPPTHIVTAEYDVLRDDGEQFVKSLEEAGVPVTHKCYDGMLHGFIHFCGIFDVGREAISDIATVIRTSTRD